ncbi:MAG: hypothetical protein WAN35_05055 [Terracidiphilus sp.]
MMFPDTSNAQQSAALRQAAERSQAASNTQYEYAYSTWTPVPPRREGFPPASLPATSYSAVREELRLISR